MSDGALHDHTPVLHKHLGEKKMLLLLTMMMKREKREKEEEWGKGGKRIMKGKKVFK